MATPLEERRIDQDGEAHTFLEFVQRYGEHRAVLIERWAASRQVEHVKLNEHAVASQLIHAFGTASLRRALAGCWCRCNSLRHPGNRRGEAEVAPERVALEVLRLSPSLATELEGPLRDGGLRSRGSLRVEPVPESVLLEALRLQPGLAASLRGGLLDGMRLPARVALELLRLDPSLTGAILQSTLSDADILYTVVKRAAMPLVADALRLRGPSLGVAGGHLLERFARDRSGMWQAMEAGITTAALWPCRWDLHAQEASVRARERAFAVWRHGEVVHRRFLMRGLRQVVPPPAAYNIAVLLCGDSGCECRVCCRRAQAGSFPDASAEATSGVAVASSKGAAHADEGAPSYQAQEAVPVEEEVEHSEPAAVIYPEEAALIIAEQWATAVDPLTGALPRAGLHADGEGVALASDDCRVVLLEFGRRPKELSEAILNSELAVRLAAEDVAVRPGWAGGRLVLVPGAVEGDFSMAGLGWHIAVLEPDEEAIFAALRSLGHDVRPRLKASGRRYIPEDDSLLSVSDGGQTGNSVSIQDLDEESELREAGEDRGQEDESEDEEGAGGQGSGRPIPPLSFPRQPVVILKTFLERPEEQSASASVRARSD